MFLYNNNYITFLEQFRDLISMGFDENKALSSLKTLCPQQRAHISKIQHLIKKGTPICNALDTMSDSPSPFQIQSTSIHLLTWLDYTISDLHQKKKWVSLLVKSCSGPVVFFLGSCLLNLIFIVVFIPQTQQMLHQFNIPIPSWLIIIQNIQHWLGRFGGLSLIICISFFIIFRTYSLALIKMIINPFYVDYLQKKLLQLLLCLTRTGATLKDIASSLCCNHSLVISSQIESFKKEILMDHSYQLAFKSILSSSVYVDILLQSLATNRLELGFSHVIKLYDIKHHKQIKMVTTIIKTSVITLTGIQLAIGFYLSMLPMNQLIRRVMQ